MSSKVERIAAWVLENYCMDRAGKQEFLISPQILGFDFSIDDLREAMNALQGNFNASVTEQTRQ